MFTALRTLFANRKSPRAKYNRRPYGSRLAFESLEDRRLLSADFGGWQNLWIPADVNSDGVVTVIDALMIVHDLRQNGTRALASPLSEDGESLGRAFATGDETPYYPDVNGDGVVSVMDALSIVHHIRLAGETYVMQFEMVATDLSGTPLAGPINVGQSFLLNVSVQDTRDPLVASRGVYQAYLDVTYDSSLVTVAGGFSHGTSYSDSTSGSAATPGLLDEVGGANLTVAPPGAAKFPLFSIPFTATSVGTVSFSGDAAEGATHNVLMFDLTTAVDPGLIDFGSTSVVIVSSLNVAVDDAYVVQEDSTLNEFDVLANDEGDPEGTPTITAVGTPNRGGAVFIENGKLVYSPAPNFFGVETFTYTASDGMGNVSSALVSVTVENVQDAPVAHPDGGGAFQTDESRAFITGNVLTNDVDADGDTLFVDSFDTAGTWGLVTYNGDGTFSYDPDGWFDDLVYGEVAFDFFEYTISDGNGGFSTSTVTITILGGPIEGHVFFRVETTDMAGTPVTEIEQNESFYFNVYVQDIRTITAEERGVYQAFLDVTYQSALVTTIGSLEFGPAYQFNPAGTLAPGLIDEVGANQTDLGLGGPYDGPLGPDEFLLFRVPFRPLGTGTVVFATNPADLAGFHDVLVFQPPEPAIATSDIVYGFTTLLIRSAPVVAGNDAFTVTEDSQNNPLNVLANDQVNSGGTLVITGVNTTGIAGTVVVSGSQLLYTPAPNFFGDETFTYTITDGLGNSDVGTVVVTVTNVNDPPVANNDSGAAFTTKENAAFTTGNVLANDTDIDGDTLSVTSINTTGTLGLVTNNNNGTFTYDPNGMFEHLAIGEQAIDTFTYTISDGHGGTSTATVTITVVGAPDAPGQVWGIVYSDTNNNGRRDAVERAIGGVVVRLEGVDVVGTPVALRAVTDAMGYYAFADLAPGNYVLIEEQPQFFVDGIDSINGVRHIGANDRITITPAMNVEDYRVDFGERSLHPDYIGPIDFLNSTSRNGIVVGFDAAGDQLWYSLLDGWDGVTAVDVKLSADRSTCVVTTWTGATGMTFGLSMMPQQGSTVLKGATSLGRVYQLLGTYGDYQLVATPASVDEAFAQLGQGAW
jgi:VCBS repeat-containing protein